MRTDSTCVRHRARWPNACLAIGFALIILPCPSRACAQTGTATGIVVGKITDKTTGEPLSGSTVEIRGTGLGNATDGRGHFIVRGVRPGSAEVTARRLGFRPLSQTIQVVAGDSVTVNFVLEESAVTLDAVVTTGTGGAVAKREVGAPIAVLDAAAIKFA